MDQNTLMSVYKMTIMWHPESTNVENGDDMFLKWSVARETTKINSQLGNFTGDWRGPWGPTWVGDGVIKFYLKMQSNNRVFHSYGSTGNWVKIIVWIHVGVHNGPRPNLTQLQRERGKVQGQVKGVVERRKVQSTSQISWVAYQSLNVLIDALNYLITFHEVLLIHASLDNTYIILC